MAIQDGSVTGTDLTRVVEDDDLSVEGSGFLSGIVLGVGGDVSTTDILDGDVPSDGSSTRGSHRSMDKLT